MMRRAVFLDRDGVICTEEGYISDPRQLRLIPGAADAIRLFNQSGLAAVVITNQSGVARGFFTEETVAVLNRAMHERLEEQGARLDAVYYCPHHPEGAVERYRLVCDCRKPATGMLRQAADECNLEVMRSYLVGDKLSDIECAGRAGVKGIMVLTGYGAEECKRLDQTPAVHPAFVAADLREAAGWILNDLRSSNHEEDIDHQAERDR
jgi:D-glycero-D-manno-heptose 1,7-bisphosphate phosphatase